MTLPAAATWFIISDVLIGKTRMLRLIGANVLNPRSSHLYLGNGFLSEDLFLFEAGFFIWRGAFSSLEGALPLLGETASLI